MTLTYKTGKVEIVTIYESDRKEREKILETRGVKILELKNFIISKIMTVREQNAYLVAISIAAKDNRLHQLPCLLDKENGETLFKENFFPAYWPLQIMKSITRLLCSASKSLLTLLG